MFALITAMPRLMERSPLKIGFQLLPSPNGEVIRQGIRTHMGERPAAYNPALSAQAPLVPKWANRDLQLQAYIASLPLATPLKGSPTATPASGKMYLPRPIGLAHQATESNVLATMQSLFSTPSSGACTPDQPQTLAAGFANHAQLLRAKLSPLVTEESEGFSRAMEKPMASLSSHSYHVRKLTTSPYNISTGRYRPLVAHRHEGVL